MSKSIINSEDFIRTSNTSDILRGRSLPVSLLAQSSLTATTAVLSPRSSEISLLNKQFKDKPKRVTDRSWSWSYLRKRFAQGKLENLYQRYILRVQIAYFNSYLLIQPILSCLLIILLILSNYDTDTGNIDLNEALPEIIRQLILVLMSFLLFFFVWDEKKFHKYPFLNFLTSVIVVSVLHLLDIGVFVYYYLQDDSQPLRTLSTLPLLIVLYFFLPIPDKRESVILGLLISATSVVCKNIIYSTKEGETSSWKSLAVADSIYYICVNVIGIYALFLREINVRRAFLDRRRCLKSTIKNNIEKEKEEQLLQSILPKHISEKVRSQLLAALQLSKLRISHNSYTSSDSDAAAGPMRKSPFSETFVERHDDISILFADIVNFTVLASGLKADELVQCLNELYGRFDAAAKEKDCLRIKLLGDCYYCTSSEARNCVELGFHMIDIIKTVRDTYQVNVAMRIGIHTGNILSGLIGMYKWQYDIWSKDVTIANCMESAGEKDMVHISKATKDFLGCEYEYIPGNGQERNPYLKENNIETFFVVPNRMSMNNEQENNLQMDYSYVAENIGSASASPNPSVRNRRDSAIENYNCYNSTPVDDTRNSSPIIFSKRVNASAITIEGNISNFLQMLTEVNDFMRNAIDEMPFIKANQCCRRNKTNKNISENISPVFMNFERISLESDFQCQDDPLFKYYVSCALFALCCVGIVMVISENIEKALWISYTCGLVFLSMLTLALWTPYLWDTFKDPKRDRDSVPKPKHIFVKAPYHFSIFVAKSFALRMFLYIVITQLISTFAIIDVMSCDNEPAGMTRKIHECSTPWYFTNSCALALLVMYSFFRVHFLLKLTIAIFSLIGYGYVIAHDKSYVFNNKMQTLPGFSPENASMYSHLMYLIAMALLLHVHDRQTEYINRLNFLWKNKLKEENDEALVTHEINTILIHNILPLEIANIYLDSSRVGEGHSRDYQNVSVMFATIPKFMDSFTDKDISGQGYFLQILNEIIIEFDQALLNYPDVEKIKVVGSTYMAACGLEVHGTGRLSDISVARSSLDDMNSNSRLTGYEIAPNIEKRCRTLQTLVKFAASMMARLEDVNKDAFQNFKLRVGITCGPLVAGVIGAEKPMYDIWGDVVNLASRMDSTGVQGKIQVNEESAMLLKLSGIHCECRGDINVKGKGLLKTYFVPLTNDYQLLPSED